MATISIEVNSKILNKAKKVLAKRYGITVKEFIKLTLLWTCEHPREAVRYFNQQRLNILWRKEYPLHKHAVRGFGLLSHYTNIKKVAIRNAKRLIRKSGLLAEHYTVDQLAHHLLYEWPTIPQRATVGSAGYDIRANETITVPAHQNKPTLVHTGIKAYCPQNEVLKLYNRSSNPIKRGLILANGVGIVDSDYYDSKSNEGELMAEFINISDTDYTVNRGDRIMQGVFEPYLTADIDSPVSSQRIGGLGSTGTH